MSIYTGEFTSRLLGCNVTTRVIFPDSPYDLEQLDTTPKTMYLLHGGGGSSGDWPRFTRIEYFARLYNFTIVLADAGNSFYSNMKYGGQYLKFFGEELPAEMNKRFKLPETTFVCGQSMGGQGAIKVGLNYPDHFRAIGAFSAGVGIRDLVASGRLKSLGVHAIWGDPLEVPVEDEPFALAERAVKEGKTLPFFLCCGTGDFVYESNVAFHKHLDTIGYEHEYWEGPGIHMWDYWEEQMPVMMEKFCALLKA